MSQVHRLYPSMVCRSFIGPYFSLIYNNSFGPKLHKFECLLGAFGTHIIDNLVRMTYSWSGPLLTSLVLNVDNLIRKQSRMRIKSFMFKVNRGPESCGLNCPR